MICTECDKPGWAKNLCTSHYNNRRYKNNSEHMRQVKRNWVAKNKDYVKQLKKNNALLKLYGITLDEYKLRVQSQQGLCKICKSSNSKRATMPDLVVDHDHKTGKIRGLLCSPCNVAIGMLGDSEERLLNVLEYLRCA